VHCTGYMLVNYKTWFIFLVNGHNTPQPKRDLLPRHGALVSPAPTSIPLFPNPNTHPTFSPPPTPFQGGFFACPSGFKEIRSSTEWLIHRFIRSKTSFASISIFADALRSSQRGDTGGGKRSFWSDSYDNYDRFRVLTARFQIGFTSSRSDLFFTPRFSWFPICPSPWKKIYWYG
jgi:hypothetical protein